MKRCHPGILALILCLILSGCGQEASLKDQVSPPAGTKAGQTPQTQPAPAVYDDSLLSEVAAKGDCLSDSGDVIFSFSYRLPLILDDTEDARMLNTQMETLCRDAESRFSVPYEVASWKHSWMGSLVSIAVEMRVPFQSLTDHFTVNYDFALGRTVSNQELVERLGRTPEEAELSLRRAACVLSDQQTVTAPQIYGESTAGLSVLRCETLSRGNLNIHGIPLYLDDRGELHGYAAIGIPAAGGYYYEDLILNPVPAEGSGKTVACDFITAELKDNSVTLTFENKGLAGLFVNPKAVEFGHPYPVEGLYGTYTDMALGFVGNGGYCYLILTDSTGHITACNVMNGMDAGFRFFALGPLAQIRDVVSLRTDAGSSSLYAVTGSGESIDLFPYLEEAGHCLPHPLQDSSWYSEDGTYFFSTVGDSPVTSYSAGGGILATGLSLQYLGMSETGMHYYCPMTDEEGNYFGCLLSLEPKTPFGSFDEGWVITLTQSFGQKLSGLRDGQLVLSTVMG